MHPMPSLQLKSRMLIAGAVALAVGGCSKADPGERGEAGGELSDPLHLPSPGSRQMRDPTSPLRGEVKRSAARPTPHLSRKLANYAWMI